jgi:TctA family transporter
MFTGVDKALTAVVLGALSIANLVWGVDLFGEHTEELVGIVIAILFPVAVYVVPNVRKREW